MYICKNVYTRQFNKKLLKINFFALCVASSFGISQVHADEVVWSENFNAPELNDKGAINNLIDMTEVTRWSIDVSDAELTANSDWFKVTNNAMEARDVDGQVDWLSETIDIQDKSNVNISLLATEQGDHEPNDYWDLAYSVDGGEFITVVNWQGQGDTTHTLIDDFTRSTIIQSIPQASSLQIKVSMQNGASKEYLRLDDVVVTANDDGASSGDNEIISNACYNCPDLSKVANIVDFDDGNYYADVFTAITSEQSIETIRFNINGVISNNHKKLDYSEVWTALTVTDEDPVDDDNVILFYRGISKSKFSNGSGSQSSNQENWNREHVWAKSHGFPSRSAYAYTDIHHLRPTDISVNSSRGNLDFDFSDTPLAEAPENRVDSNSFEPRDAVKGDVARIIFYMDVRYAGLDSITPDLQVVNMLTSTGEAKLGKLCTLLSWNESDPVDDFEKNRNDKIYEFQGNRNPFIDHPEWIDIIFEKNCSVDPEEPVDPIDPSNPSADLFFSEYVEGSSFNKAVEIYNPTSSIVSLTNYQFKLYSNGSETPTATYNLTGEILANDVLVLGSTQITDSSELNTYIDQFSSAINFNGDDYIELVNGDTIIDTIGFYAVKENWGKNVTLVRKAEITSGDNNRNDDFIRDEQWLAYNSNTFNFLGLHLADNTPTNPSDDIVIGQCSDSADKIHDIQGNENASLVVGETKVIEGIVTAITENLNGFFIQEEFADYDNEQSTSEGIFVYSNAISTFPTVGNKVRVLGTVKESYDRTQLTAQSDFIDCGADETIAATSLSLPILSSDSWENYEGMLVDFNSELKVTDIYNLARYGQLTLSNGRLIIPTNIFAAGTDQAIALADKNSRNRIMLDDMNNTQNPEVVPFPTPNLSYQNPLRLGDSVTGVTGILDYSFSEYRILPIITPQFNTGNERPTIPQLSDIGSLKVASFNVLNYFNGDGAGQGFPTARGADNVAEFMRQSSKIVSALIDIDADIIGLMEIENDGYSANSAIADLVDKLNQRAGSDIYAFVSINQNQLGSDAIAVGFIYKPATVALVGNAITTNQSPFDYGNRQPLVQTFMEIVTQEELTIAVNHFKSKGSCGSASGNNQDQNDGQGCWNELRTQAASSLIAWLNTKPTGTVGNDVLVIGDLNSYGKEDPINMFTNNGYHNLVAKSLGYSAYSYSYGGEMGYLDHALASSELATKIVDTTAWHINADEPRIFDYNTEYKSTDQLESYFGDDAYRSSDHDPIIISLKLQSNTELIGDFDNDGDIDRNDVRQFSLLLRSNNNIDIRYDFNDDNQVNSSDVRALMSLCTRSRCAI
ncbi:MAG: ExeM/NucH family extracellular endonuclease [Colwellia sp.]